MTKFQRIIVRHFPKDKNQWKCQIKKSIKKSIYVRNV